MTRHLGNARVDVHWNQVTQEYRAEAAIEELRCPGLIVGYSPDSPHLAIDNMRHCAALLGITFYIGAIVWRTENFPEPTPDIGRGEANPE